MNRLGLLVVIAITLASGQRGSAQGSQQSDCEKQAIVVNARDKQGQFVPSLQASDFRAKFGGKDVNVASLSHGAGTHRVVILLDKSGSIDSESKLKIEKFIGGELVRSLPETTQFALVAFGSRVLETLEFGHSRAEILSAIDRLTSSPGKGETALRDALVYSSDLLGPAQIGDSVVVVSDGQDNRSKTSFATVKHAYWSKGIRMFLFEFIDHYFQTPEERSDQEDSATLSADTGGMVRRIERPEAAEVLSATHEIEDDLSNYYLVQVGLPQSGQEAISLQLELMDSSGRRRKDVRLSFPQKHLPCAMLAHP